MINHKSGRSLPENRNSGESRTVFAKLSAMGAGIIGASLAFAAVICLLIGGWHDLSVGYSGMKKRLARKFGSEYDDYADEELYE